MYLMYVKDCSDWCLVNEGATDIEGLESLHNSLSGVHTHTEKLQCGSVPRALHSYILSLCS